MNFLEKSITEYLDILCHNIKTGNSNLSEQELLTIIDICGKLPNPYQKMSKE
jgi:hypothetical protein